MSQWLTMYNRNNNTKDLYIDVDYWWSPRIRSKKRRRTEKPDPRHREGPAIKGTNGGTKSSSVVHRDLRVSEELTPRS
jgi:hypothetical protein